MPAKYKRCVKHVEDQGKSTSSAHAICTSVNAGNIKKVRREEASGHDKARSERQARFSKKYK